MKYGIEHVRTELFDGTALTNVGDMPLVVPADLASVDIRLASPSRLEATALPYVARCLGAHVGPDFYSALNDALYEVTGSEATSGVAVSIARLTVHDATVDFVHTGSEYFQTGDHVYSVGQLVSASNHIATAGKRPNMSNIARLPEEDRVTMSGTVLGDVFRQNMSGGLAMWEAPYPPNPASVSGRVLRMAGAAALGNYIFQRGDEQRNFIVNAFNHDQMQDHVGDIGAIVAGYIELQAERSMQVTSGDGSVRTNARIDRKDGGVTVVEEVSSVSISDYITLIGEQAGLR